jgi:hypothetical protein
MLAGLTSLLMRQAPIWAAVIIVVSVVFLFLALFMQTSNISWVISRIEKTELAFPDDIEEELLEPANLVRSYAARVDMSVVRSAGTPRLVDKLLVYCPLTGAAELKSCTYRTAYWLPLIKSQQSLALGEDVETGRVRYVYIGGVAARIVSASERHDIKDSVPVTATKDTHVTFVVAAAYDATIDDRETGCGMTPLVLNDPPAVSAFSAVLPLLAVDPTALGGILLPQSGHAKELHVQLIGYAFSSPHDTPST